MPVEVWILLAILDILGNRSGVFFWRALLVVGEGVGISHVSPEVESVHLVDEFCAGFSWREDSRDVEARLPHFLEELQGKGPLEFSAHIPSHDGEEVRIAGFRVICEEGNCGQDGQQKCKEGFFHGGSL